MKSFAALLLFLISSVPLSAQSILEYTLEKGATFTIKQDAEQVITQEIDGATHELTNKINGILEFKVLMQRDSIYEIALTFKDLNLKMTSSIQGELMNVHAKAVNEDDMQSKIFGSLLNSPIQMVLAKTGNILEVKGGDSLVIKMAEASGLEDGFSLNMMKKSLQKEFGSEALSDSYEQMTFIYAKKPVKIGDTWKNEYAGKLRTKNTWTLEALSKNEAIIHGTADISMDVTELATAMKLAGTQQTRVVTDTASGFIKIMTVEGQSQGTSTITQLDDQEIPTSIKSKITYERMDAYVE